MRRSVALVVFSSTLLAACGGGNSPPPQLVDGTDPPEVPAPLAGLDGAVMTRVQVVRRARVELRILRACDRLLTGPFDPDLVVVERVAVEGASLTFASSTLNGCNAIRQPAPDPDRRPGDPWCSGVVGKLEAGRLSDPRLSLCASADGTLTAFAWVQPGPGTRWLVIRSGDRREIYRVAVGLPIRVATTTGIDPERASASFDIEEYGRDGNELRSYVLDAAVAG